MFEVLLFMNELECLINLLFFEYIILFVIKLLLYYLLIINLCIINFIFILRWFFMTVSVSLFSSMVQF